VNSETLRFHGVDEHRPMHYSIVITTESLRMPAGARRLAMRPTS
jgi:hypothetical protein